MLRVGNRVVLWWYTLIIRMLCGSEAERLQVWGKTYQHRSFQKEREEESRREKRKSKEERERKRKGVEVWKEREK